MGVIKIRKSKPKRNNCHHHLGASDIASITVHATKTFKRAYAFIIPSPKIPPFPCRMLVKIQITVRLEATHLNFRKQSDQHRIANFAEHGGIVTQASAENTQPASQAFLKLSSRLRASPSPVLLAASARSDHAPHIAHGRQPFTQTNAPTERPSRALRALISAAGSSSRLFFILPSPSLPSRSTPGSPCHSARRAPRSTWTASAQLQPQVQVQVQLQPQP